MKNMRLILAGTLLSLLGVFSAVAQTNLTGYRPTERATALEDGTTYMIYNTAFNDAEDRTGFINSAASGFGHTGDAHPKPSAFSTMSNTYLWKVTKGSADHSYYFQSVATGKYASATGTYTDAAQNLIYVQDWSTSSCPKPSGTTFKSENHDGTTTLASGLTAGSGVWTICGTSVSSNGQSGSNGDCWNGNPSTWARWGVSHPFAFYKVEETNVTIPANIPVPGKTYYIYCDNDTRQYFYNDNGTLKVSNGITKNAELYKFTCTSFDGTSHQLRNVSSGKYFGFKAFTNEGYNLTISDGVPSGTATHIYCDAASKYLVMKNDGAFDQSTNANYVKGSSDYSANYVFVPVEDVPVLVVGGNPLAEATAAWNGKTQALPAAFALTDDETITAPTLSLSLGSTAYKFYGFVDSNSNNLGATVDVSSLSGTVSYTAVITPNIFSGNYGDKWIRVRNSRSNAYGFALLNDTPAAGQNIDTETIDAASENNLWCFVGTPDNFKMYSKMSASLVIAHDGTPANGEAVTFAEASAESAAQSWALKDYTSDASVAGYSIIPAGDTQNIGLNPHGGIGNVLKFYGNGDGGNRWYFEVIDTEKYLTQNITVDGTAFDGNAVAQLTYTVNGTRSVATITGAQSSKAYLPAGASISLTSFTYRGFDLTACTLNGAAYDGSEFTLEAAGENALNLTYTANADRMLFKTPDANGKPYRIPAIATAKNGHIIAVADNRPCGSDVGYGEVDLKARISKDNGATWGTEFFIANGTGVEASPVAFDYAFGDAAIVADRESNKVLVLAVCGKTVCWNGNYTLDSSSNPNRVAKVVGTYNETSGEWEWTAPVEVTDKFYPLFVKDGTTVTVASLFVGSGRIMQSRVVKKGDYYRLYAALWTKNQGNRVVYSDDFGENWNILGTVDDRPATSGDEPKCEELPDGTVILSSRKGSGRYFNLFTFADDTFTSGTWGTAVSSNDVSGGLTTGDSGTNGEIFCLKDVLNKTTGAKETVMLQSVPKGTGRKNVSIWYKVIDSATQTPETFATGWTLGKQVSFRNSAYSTMTLQQDNRIGFLFEEEPGGYTIVYTPLTIDDATGGAYTVYNDANRVEVAINTLAEPALAMTGVGYPVAGGSSRAALEAAKTEARNSTGDIETRLAGLSSAVTAYKSATSDIQMPESGKAYTIANINWNGVKRYMKYAETGISFGTTDAGAATPFICRELSAGKYTFVCNAGKYLVWKGNSAGANGYKGYVDAFNYEEAVGTNNYTDWTQIIIEKMMAGGYVNSAKKQADLFGYMVFKGRRDNAINYTVIKTDGSYDKASAPFFNANYSSVIVFEEVDYPNNVRLNAIGASDVLLKGIETGQTIGTFSAPFATLIPEGVTAYAATLLEGGDGARMTAVTEAALPANQGVVLIGEATKMQALMVPAADETTADLSSNIMGNSAGAAHALTTGDYILGRGTQGIGFYQGTGTLPMNKAYLPTPSSTVNGFKLVFGDVTTEIQSVKDNGTEEIDADAPVYDLTGRRVANMQKGGIYIRGGRKFFVK